MALSDRTTTTSYGPAPKRRIRPWRALCAFARSLRDPEDTENGARFVMALEGNRGERNFQRFAHDPLGARILTEQRSLLAVLSDRETLRSLPVESLGRAYLAFVESEAISAEGLASAVAPVEQEMGPLVGARKLFAQRTRDMHDLWHVVTGYSRDLMGELQLLAFSYEQLGTRAFRFIVPLATLANERKAPETRQLIALAKERGAESAWLPAADWEALLPRPLAEVRQRLGVGPAPRYTRYFRNPTGFGLVAEHELDAFRTQAQVTASTTS